MNAECSEVPAKGAGNEISNWKNKYFDDDNRILPMCEGCETKVYAWFSRWKTERYGLKVHKIENFFDSDFGICVISLIVMSKY